MESRTERDRKRRGKDWGQVRSLEASTGVRAGKYVKWMSGGTTLTQSGGMRGMWSSGLAGKGNNEGTKRAGTGTRNGDSKEAFRYA